MVITFYIQPHHIDRLKEQLSEPRKSVKISRNREKEIDLENHQGIDCINNWYRLYGNFGK